MTLRRSSRFSKLVYGGLLATYLIAASTMTMLHQRGMAPQFRDVQQIWWSLAIPFLVVAILPWVAALAFAPVIGCAQRRQASQSRARDIPAGTVAVPGVPPTSLRAAILRFDDWDEPWRFHDSVTAALDRPDAELFEQVWREAIDASRWTSGDLSACARRASFDLRSRFAVLDTEAADAVARAAAYQWR